MAIQGMNHFNVLTDDVERTRRFYVDVVGLTKRPSDISTRPSPDADQLTAKKPSTPRTTE